MAKGRSPNVNVYYGAHDRWDQEELNLATAIIGHDCEGFDGLQADFCVDPDKIEDVVVKLNAAGLLSEATVDGKRIGKPCPSEAESLAKRTMRRLYRERGCHGQAS